VISVKARTIALAAALCVFGALPALADDGCEGKGDTRITVQITGMHSANGQLAVTLYPDDARRFLASHGKLLRQRLATKAPMTLACFLVPKPGVYAIAVYHDENGDQDFNRSALGMPAEGFGFSNDAPTKFGLPAFDAVRFRAGAGETRLGVKLRYVK
jgi:uncharacterized protein (DUF2141 family)